MVVLKLALASWLAAQVTWAQVGETGPNNDTESTQTLIEDEITIHRVTVGLLEHEFHPNSIIANPGMYSKTWATINAHGDRTTTASVTPRDLQRRLLILILWPGDKVVFEFYPGNHSVIESLYKWPCIPKGAYTGSCDDPQLLSTRHH